MATTATEPDAKPRRLGWLLPPEPSEDGTMALMDHLREVRYRVAVSAVAIVLVAVALFILVSLGTALAHRIVRDDFEIAEPHEHEHGIDCGHEAIAHDDHIDYVHDGQLHAAHQAHYDVHGVVPGTDQHAPVPTKEAR